jgi:hypothetical protein
VADLPADRLWPPDGHPATDREPMPDRHGRRVAELEGWARWVRTVTDQQHHANGWMVRRNVQET